MSAGKGGSNPIGGPAPMPGQPSPGEPSPGMPAQDPYNRPEATNLPRYAGQPGYPGTGPYTPRPDLGPDVGFGPGLPPQNNPPQDIPDWMISVGPGISPREFPINPTPMPMPGMPGGKAGPGLFQRMADIATSQPGYTPPTSSTGFARPGVPFGPAGSPVTGQPVANQYTRTRTNPGNRFIPSNAPGR